MIIIKSTPNPSGAYPPATSWNKSTPPSDWLEVSCDTALISEYNGFVTLTVEGGKVISMSSNGEAWEAWKASLPPEAAPGPSAGDITLDLMAEHEERLCMLELASGS